MKPILEVHHISKQYKIRHLAGGYLSLREKLSHAFKTKNETSEDFWALKDVSFEVNAGESIGIVGSNGAGKSTLLKILSKITPPTTGKIISRGRIASLLEVGTGFHPELTGRENIFLNGSLLGMKRLEIQEKFDQIVDFSGTERFLDTPLKHFSSGMQLRLAFAVAAFLEPEILIIDEVLAVGDAEFQKKCLGKMEEVTNSGRTILFVSHNMAAVEHLCVGGILMRSGSVLERGPIRSVIAAYLKNGVISTEQGEIPLSNGVVVKKFQLSSPSISPFDTLSYELIISSPFINQITDLAILIYNHLQERIGIIDLRHADLFKLSAAQSEVIAKGTIVNIPLVEGTYHFGLYMSSSVCQGDFLSLRTFYVNPLAQQYVPYAAKYRGSVEFENKFSIQ